MALLSVTDRIQGILKEASAKDSDVLDSTEKETILDMLEKGKLRVKNLDILKKYLDHRNATRGEKMSLLDCIRGAEASLSPDYEASRDEEEALIRHRDYLRVQSETREYNRMVFGTER